ncbi:hypothetical protein SO802_005377 [Lithocarpus litseifolius]|uniref:Uncharacterized protein n=1 Tax=Lithocarpus litseifolius TaxID=425828 RepID=A0AAW2DL74_9ROSI
MEIEPRGLDFSSAILAQIFLRVLPFLSPKTHTNQTQNKSHFVFFLSFLQKPMNKSNPLTTGAPARDLTSDPIHRLKLSPPGFGVPGLLGLVRIGAIASFFHWSGGEKPRLKRRREPVPSPERPIRSSSPERPIRSPSPELSPPGFGPNRLLGLLLLSSTGAAARRPKPGFGENRRLKLSPPGFGENRRLKLPSLFFVETDWFASVVVLRCFGRL